VRFVNGRQLKKGADPDFQLWHALLAFLGCKYRDLEQFAAKLPFGPIAALTAWKQFGLVSTFKDICHKVEHSDENAEFFHAHDMNVVIRKPLTQKVYVPTDILEVLNPKQIIMRDSELMYPKRNQYYFR
jgi:hypothetical protein